MSVSERSLQTRLRTYLQKPDLAASLADFDRHGLLMKAAAASPASLDDILASDDGLLDDPNSGIFELKHARSPAARPDRVSERVPCADFEAYPPLVRQGGRRPCQRSPGAA